MCCFNKVNLSAILLVHKRIINKDCAVKNNNEISAVNVDLAFVHVFFAWVLFVPFEAQWLLYALLLLLLLLCDSTTQNCTQTLCYMIPKVKNVRFVGIL